MTATPPDGIQKILIGIGLYQVSVGLQPVAFNGVVQRGGAENHTAALAHIPKGTGGVYSVYSVHINVKKEQVG